ncbi:urea carboxylase-associated family protein [Trichlorobacter lovleyi]|uniref:urea amidolyase associated protein UAAP2 n=1 Tax=Trichlorobacter lovleyi TaxID=313985 RepID=UPI002240CC88|nr:urea amidolyase associated protein UAAP2 [Trichlorobacter lovleyi]QOX80373.1 urea carboxylase-associated family protein [Trichlorobacter lovleyi]
MSMTPLQESPLDPRQAVYETVLPAGEHWMHLIQKGQTFRIIDLEGNQAVDTLFYNAHDYSERYSAVDTIREQGNVYLSTGSPLLSSEGNTMLVITADTCGRHDTLGGGCSAESNSVRYPRETRYMHNCRDTFMQGLLQWGQGMDKREITHNINFFMNVPISPEGKSTFADGISEPGKYVEMRAEMDVICLISNCPQLNNPCNAYNPTPVRLLIWD